MCFLRINVPNLCPSMNHFDAVDFSECHSEEVISFFWRSVYMCLCLYHYVFKFLKCKYLPKIILHFVIIHVCIISICYVIFVGKSEWNDITMKRKDVRMGGRVGVGRKGRGRGCSFLPVLENITTFSWKREIRSYNQTVILMYFLRIKKCTCPECSLHFWGCTGGGTAPPLFHTPVGMWL